MFVVLEELPRREKLLLVLRDYSTPQPESSTVVAAWQRFPTTFGLLGAEAEHPDARCAAELQSIPRQWLDRTQNGVTLTDEGRAVADGLLEGRPLPEVEISTRDRLNELAARRPRKAYHPWQKYADLVSEGGIMSATPSGFTVGLGDGERIVRFDGGLTERHYAYFAPLLTPLDQCELAHGVVENLLGPDVTWGQLDAAWSVLRECCGRDEEGWLPEEDWLPGLIEGNGLRKIADEMAHYIRTIPPFQPACVVAAPKPYWIKIAGQLWFGDHRWTVRRQEGPLNNLLNEFQRQQWPPAVQLPGLDPDQVKATAKQLREKTRGVINWHASSDGNLSWSIPRP
jgi:hypothetical protein